MLVNNFPFNILAEKITMMYMVLTFIFPLTVKIVKPIIRKNNLYYEKYAIQLFLKVK
jgi:hypothetical protein